MTYIIESTLKFYNIEVSYLGDSVKIVATNRFGRNFVMWLKRTDKTRFGNKGDFWEAGCDFDIPYKVHFKANLYSFAEKLIAEVREYDQRFYRFKALIRFENKEERNLTWEEARVRKSDTSEEPIFKGSLTIKRSE